MPLNVIRIKTRSGNNGERVRAFFEAYDVPEDKQMVPLVLLTDTIWQATMKSKRGWPIIYGKVVQILCSRIYDRQWRCKTYVERHGHK